MEQRVKCRKLVVLLLQEMAHFNLFALKVYSMLVDKNVGVKKNEGRINYEPK